MQSTQVHKLINLLLCLPYRMGFWHRGDEPTIKDLAIKWFYCSYYLIFTISLGIGSVISESVDDRIFLAEVTVIVTVLLIKLSTLIWKQKQILRLLNKVCVFPIQDEDASFFNYEVGRFIKLLVACICLTLIIINCVAATSFFRGEKVLFIQVALPFDIKNSDTAFFFANVYMITQLYLTVVPIGFSMFTWYILLHCSLRYYILGRHLTRFGQFSTKKRRKISENEKNTIFLHDVKTGFLNYLRLREYNFFGFSRWTLRTIYALAFVHEKHCYDLVIILLITLDILQNLGADLVQRFIHIYRLTYNMSELFMIAYFGNEIMLSSDRLSYSLFESKWMEQPQYTKRCIIIFGEILMQPHTVMVAKLYRLDLDLFIRIVKSAYSMFNILKTLK